jgi:hypothetical protein
VIAGIEYRGRRLVEREGSEPSSISSPEQGANEIVITGVLSSTIRWGEVEVNYDVQRKLLSGERVLWEGRPYTGLILRPIDAFLIPFSLLWFGSFVYWEVSAWAGGAPISFSLIGLPFVVFGLFMTVGRFLVDMHIRRRMLYLVTDRRVLILRNEGTSTSKSIDVWRLPVLELQELSDGSGTLRFGESGGMFAAGGFAMWAPTFDPTPQFLRIDNVRSVYELIQKQADSVPSQTLGSRF